MSVRQHGHSVVAHVLLLALVPVLEQEQTETTHVERGPGLYCQTALGTDVELGLGVQHLSGQVGVHAALDPATLEWPSCLTTTVEIEPRSFDRGTSAAVQRRKEVLDEARSVDDEWVRVAAACLALARGGWNVVVAEQERSTGQADRANGAGTAQERTTRVRTRVVEASGVVGMSAGGTTTGHPEKPLGIAAWDDERLTEAVEWDTRGLAQRVRLCCRCRSRYDGSITADGYPGVAQHRGLLVLVLVRVLADQQEQPVDDDGVGELEECEDSLRQPGLGSRRDVKSCAWSISFPWQREPDEHTLQEHHCCLAGGGEGNYGALLPLVRRRLDSACSACSAWLGGGQGVASDRDPGTAEFAPGYGYLMRVPEPNGSMS